MDRKSLEEYEFVFDENIMAGVYGITVTTAPANGVQAFFFNEDKPSLIDVKMSNEEKRLVTSVVLIPNKRLYRNDVNGAGAGFVYFTEDVIEKVQQNFAKTKSNHNSTLNHIDKLEGVYFTESWIVTDPMNDKANALGFKQEDIPKGSWIATMKVENDDLWNDYIKTGIIKGFSIDALLATKKVNKEQMNRTKLQTVIEMSIQRVALSAGLVKYTTKDGEEVYASELILENVLTDEAGNPLPDKDFTVEGIVYQTDGSGVIVKADAEEVKEEETAVEEVIQEEEVSVEEVKVEEDEKAIKIAELEAEVAELNSKYDALETEKNTLEADKIKAEVKAVEMSLDKPATQGIKNAPTKEAVPASGVLGALRKNS